VDGFPSTLSELTNLYIAVDNNRAVTSRLDFLSASPQLRELTLFHQGITHLEIPEGLGLLEKLTPGAPKLREIALPTDLHSLRSVSLFGNYSEITLPEGMSSLTDLYLSGALTNILWPSDLASLNFLWQWGNRLRTLTLPTNLKESLTSLYLAGNPLSDFAFLKDFHRLALLSIHSEGLPIPSELRRITLPDGLASLRVLQVGYLYGWDSHPDYLALPACVDLNRLNLEGFVKESVVVNGLWIQPPSFLDDGQISVTVRGATGKKVTVQRSTDLSGWQAWKTAAIVNNNAELTDSPSPASTVFFRVEQPATP
jgi:Leucine-rich repeat (LRR) protein